MFRHDDDVNGFNAEGSLKYKAPTEINESYVRVNKISKSLLDELNAYLKSKWSDNGEYAPSADIIKKDGGDAIFFEIHWGDWKHDHIRLWYLVNEFFRDRGYIIEREVEVTDEDGSDTYSAEHTFIIQGDDENDDVKEMHEGWLDDVKADNIKNLEINAGNACTAMGRLISSLNNDTKEAWEEQITSEDIEAMKHASDAAWLLYHYRKDGKVRPLKKR